MAALDNYWNQSMHNLQPFFDFIEPGVTAAGNFLTSGENYDPNISTIDNFTQSFQTPVTTTSLFDEENNYAIPEMQSTYSVTDVPSASGYTTTINDGIDYASGDPWHEMGSPNLDWNSGADPFNQANNYYTGTGTGIDTADDRFRREAEANLKRNTGNTSTNTTNINTGGGGGGGGGAYSVPQAPAASLFQDLSQRTLSGTYYSPDLSAYNDSSLFNYTGPGGLSEYTYGQGLPYQGAGYDIWGTPADMVNPYYTGQFAAEQATGVADGAISLPPVDMPAGVSATNNNPNVGTSNANIIPTQGTGPGGKDLTYQETLDYFNLNPYAQSTTFPSPGGSNQSLFDRQLAEMSPEQIARMNQILDDENRMQQGQLGNDKLTEEQRLNKDVKKTQPISWIDMGNNYDDPIKSGEWEAQQNFLRPPASKDSLGSDTGIEFGDVPDDYSVWNNEYDLGRPGDPSYEEFVANPSLFTTATQTPERTYGDVNANNVASDYADFKSIAENQRLEDYKNDLRNRNMFRNSVLYPRTTIEGSPAYGGLDGFPGEFGLHNQEPYNKAAFDFAGMPPERSIWKGDEIDIQTPFRPSGVEGEDFYQGNDGKFYNTFDDLGLEALGPPSMDSSLLDRELGTGDANPQQILPSINAFQPPRPSNPADITGRTAYESPGARAAYMDFMNLPDDSYEKELHLGQIQGESTSNLTAKELANSQPLYQIPDRTYGDVNANNVASDYAGFEGTRHIPSVYDLPADSYEREVYLGQIPAESTSNILSEQEFNDSKGKFINIIKEGFESIPEKPAWQSSTVKDTDVYSSAKDSDMTMSTVAPTGTGYPGENSTPFDINNPLDQIVLQKIIQDSAVARNKPKYNQPAPITPSEVASIFNPGPPNISMKQIKPLVARTRNNMTVPVMRDAALTKRYGNPYSRYGL
jgi:hypothetical protein